LLALRESSKNGYTIPRGGLFNYISCPNFFGEILEWTGFAIMTWSPAALAFALWSFVNLITRALDHHKWYRNRFEDYPQKRKAIIPYIL
jgi:3-oxo-5-alpha-steroid 4-dehydrogenase 1